MSKVEQYIKAIPDFPEEGIIFRDITSVLCDGEGLHLAIDELAELAGTFDADYIAGMEARGFMFAVPVAYKLGLPFVPFRKKGKLPRETVGITYELEYGTEYIETHKGDIPEGSKVLLLDDLLATGGTLAAAAELVKKIGCTPVGAVCLIELKGLKGRDKMGDIPVKTVVQYEGK